MLLTGPSGSGKSSLLSLIGGLRSVQAGSLQVFGQELSGASPWQLVKIRRKIGYIFQRNNLLRFLTVQQNVQMTLKLQPKASIQDIQSRAKNMLDAVGLSHRRHHYPQNLSGGGTAANCNCLCLSQPASTHFS